MKILVLHTSFVFTILISNSCATAQRSDIPGRFLSSPRKTNREGVRYTFTLHCLKRPPHFGCQNPRLLANGLTQTVDFYQRFSDPDFSIGNRELFSKIWKFSLGFETPTDDENYQFNSNNFRHPKQNSCFISIRLVFILKQIWFCSIIILKCQQ